MTASLTERLRAWASSCVRSVASVPCARVTVFIPVRILTTSTEKRRLHGARPVLAAVWPVSRNPSLLSFPCAQKKPRSDPGRGLLSRSGSDQRKLGTLLDVDLEPRDATSLALRLQGQIQVRMLVDLAYARIEDVFA